MMRCGGTNERTDNSKGESKGRNKWMKVDTAFGLSMLTPPAYCCFTGYHSNSRKYCMALSAGTHAEMIDANCTQWLTSLFSLNFRSNFPFLLLPFFLVSSFKNTSRSLSLSSPVATTSLSTLHPSNHAAHSPGDFLLPFKGNGPAARQSDVSVWEIPEVFKSGCLWYRPTFPQA